MEKIRHTVKTFKCMRKAYTDIYVYICVYI